MCAISPRGLVLLFFVLVYNTNTIQKQNNNNHCDYDYGVSAAFTVKLPYYFHIGASPCVVPFAFREKFSIKRKIINMSSENTYQFKRLQGNKCDELNNNFNFKA